MIENYRKLLDLIMSEGLDKIESLTDEELREVMEDVRR
jgi:hypothetical protein